MKFTPQGIIFPVSTAILDRIDDYRKVLESYSLLVPIINPIDYDLVYSQMLDSILSLINTYNIAEDAILINITSGTLTMTACWILLT
jgi:sigma54-dependent transcription regulator